MMFTTVDSVVGLDRHMRCLVTVFLLVLIESAAIASEIGDIHTMVRPRTPADSTEDPIASAWVEREDFLAYFWPSFRSLARDSIALVAESLVSRRAWGSNAGGSVSSLRLYTIESRKSLFLASTYWLLYEIGAESFLGGASPNTVFFVEHPDSESLFPLDSAIYDRSQYGSIIWSDPHDGWKDPMQDTAAADYVGADLRSWDWDSASVLQMASDVISLVSIYRPMIVLDDAMEIYEYSNAVADDDLWEQYVTTDHDTISTLLTSVLIRGVRGNRYFDGNYGHAEFDFEEFAPYDSIVSPPTCRVLDGGDFEAIIFTWSPESGALNQWTIRVSKSKKLDIQCRIIAREIGITFSSY